jgi:L-ribulose-5-phosphate 3-epimerase UlaE
MKTETAYIVFTSDKFFSELRKKHGLGVFGRKVFLKILRDLGFQFEEMDRDRVKTVLDELSVSAKVKTADIVKAVALALFTPTIIFFAIAKKVYYVDGVKSNNDFIILHLTLEIPRAFRTTLFYHLFITIPISKKGYKDTVHLYKKLRSEVSIEPLTIDVWENLKTIREKNAEVLKVRGLLENLWQTILA